MGMMGMRMMWRKMIEADRGASLLFSFIYFLGPFHYQISFFQGHGL